jgi:iron complex transport system substrate-binding protein
MNVKVIAAVSVVILITAGIGAFLIFSNNAKGGRTLTSIALEVYGNADGDSDVDEQDATLVTKYIDTTKDSTDEEINNFTIENKFDKKFADANLDGAIDGQDVDQIRSVVNGNAETLWFVDGTGSDRSVGLDISRIGAEYYSNTELCLILGLADKVVAVDNAPYIYRDFYFTEKQKENITNLVSMNEPDYGFVNELNLDILLTFYTNSYDVKQTKLIGTDVVYLGMYNPDMSDAEGSNFIQGILKAGYIFGAVDRAEEYAAWILDTRDRLAEVAASIPEEEKATVLMSNYPGSYFIDPDTTQTTVYCYTDPLGQACLLGGCKNIGESLYGSTYNESLSQKSQVDALFNDDDSVTIDYIFLHNVKYTYAGTTVSGVPDHGYLADNDSDMADAWAEATSSEHTLLSDMDPNNIYLIAGDFRNGPTGSVILGAYIGHIVNPDKYKDIDPYELHNYYINHFLGIQDYDVSEDGVFLYHDPN